MNDEAWNTAVAMFRGVVDNEAADDHTIQQGWKTLRQEYGERFQAKALPHPAAQQNLQPFSLWAADHLEAAVIERVLRVVFAKELAGCDHMSLLRSTASKANTTMWHILLYFGVSVFSSHLLGHVRKRVHVFEKDPVTGIWAFPDMYSKMLRAAAQRLKTTIDSTAIPCPAAARIFTKPDLIALAPANPEFDKTSQRKPAAGSADVIQGEASTANVVSNVDNPGAIAAPPEQHENSKRLQKKPGLHSTINIQTDKLQSVSSQRSMKKEAGEVAAAIDELQSVPSKHPIKKEAGDFAAAIDELKSVPSKRPIQEEVGQVAVAIDDRGKRAKRVVSHSALLQHDNNWDDDTILHILNCLVSICPVKWTVIDGIRDHTTSSLGQLRGEDGQKEHLLVLLKYGGEQHEQHVLAIVNLEPLSDSKKIIIQYYDSAGPQYEDAAADYKPAVRLAHLLTNILPGLNLSQAEWETKHCSCPKLVSEKDSGLAVSLAAIYAIGGRPLPENWDWQFMRHIVIGGFFHGDSSVLVGVRQYRRRLIRKLIRQGKMPGDFLTYRGRQASPEEIEELPSATRNPVERIEWREENSRRLLTIIHEGYNVFQALQEQVDLGQASFRAQLDKHAYIQSDLRCKLGVGTKDLPIKIEDDEQTEESFNRATLHQATKEHARYHGHLKGLVTAEKYVQNASHILEDWRRQVYLAIEEKDESVPVKSIE
ncbi:hypothetical protein VPNG_00361 [Cytospora leucostoma]|uniref:Uncharacterized protein n=1 Tax=Cytospora leucostoma TaxID=1230097 RepID=A0A423XNY6_9PEZI|nr:hypothetical protein VPNG_00361 [Cytospora leucostoma]